MSTARSFQIERYVGDPGEWDSYVLAHPEGRFCHLTAYHQAVRNSYGLDAIPFAMRRNGRLIGLIAICAGRSLVFGRKWISMPYTEYGGFLVNDDVGDVEAAGLVDAIIAEARRHSVRCVEINGILGLNGTVKERFTPFVGYEAAVLDLSAGPEELLRKTVTYEVRKALRKAESRGLTTREASDPRTLCDIFYPMHLESMRRLGVPPHGRSYFTELKAAFGDDMKVFWAERDGVPLAGLMGIRCGARVQIFATVSSPEEWEDRPNDLAHWAYIRFACEEGARWFDFGSVRYEGQRRFKKKWGATFQPAAHWIADLSGGRSNTTFDSSSESLSRASRIWRATVPIKATQWLGPVLRRQLLR